MAKICSSDRVRKLAVALLLVGMLASAGCKKKIAAAPERPTTARSTGDRHACAENASAERMKALAFEQAKQVRAGAVQSLDRMASASVAHLDHPTQTRRDEALHVTLCKARLVIELPHGATDAFNGARQLGADVEYGVQDTKRGSDQVYQLSGAEPIAYRLAALDLKDANLAQSAPAPRAVPRPARTYALSRSSYSVRAASARNWAREPRLTSRGRPSFDCRSARSHPDRIICRDERLAALDRVESSLYRRAVGDSGGRSRAALRRTHSAFLARRARCASPGCLAKTYRDRMDEIDRIASSN